MFGVLDHSVRSGCPTRTTKDVSVENTAVPLKRAILSDVKHKLRYVGGLRVWEGIAVSGEDCAHLSLSYHVVQFEHLISR